MLMVRRSLLTYRNTTDGKREVANRQKYECKLIVDDRRIPPMTKRRLCTDG